MTKDKFPNYKPEQVNSLAVVITDKTIYCETSNKNVVEILKDQTDANKFVEKLISFCIQHGYMVESTGTRDQMAARLYKKDGKDLITEAEAVAYANQIINYTDGREQTLNDLHNWRKEVHDMK